MKNFVPSLLIAFVLLLGCVATRTSNTQTTALDKGRNLYAQLMAGKADSLYALMTPNFQAAVNGQEGFEKLMQQLPEQLGKEIKVEQEATFQEAGFTSYYRISQFDKNPSITTRFVWKNEALHGLNVKPTVQPAKSDYVNYSTKTPLQLPFNDVWYVAWGGRESYLNYHVSAPDQRFAYDFLYAKNQKIAIDSPTKKEDYFGFGKPIFSPAAGTVIVAVDSVADNALGTVNSQSPPGNYVVIDHGNGEYSFLAHFKRGTVAVTEGSQVKTGDLLGQCGNSGQSTLPHLHYHLQTGKDYKKGEGLPAFFNTYVADGEKIKRGEPVRGQYISPLNYQRNDAWPSHKTLLKNRWFIKKTNS